MSGALELGAVGLTTAALCLGAYIYAFIWKPVGGRWLQILGLISTLIALVLLSFDLRVGSVVGAPIHRVAAESFLVVAAVAQALSALRRRRGERRADRRSETAAMAETATQFAKS
jgi:hypothetical protein